MKKDKFNKKDLEFYLNDHHLLGLSKEYILECIFNKDLQSKWYPKIGDLIVGCTGNIFAIGGSQHFHSSVGGEVFFYGGMMAASKGSKMDTPISYSMNKGGGYFKSPYHTSWKNYRYIPRPE